METGFQEHRNTMNVPSATHEHHDKRLMEVLFSRIRGYPLTATSLRNMHISDPRFEQGGEEDTRGVREAEDPFAGVLDLAARDGNGGARPQSETQTEMYMNAEDACFQTPPPLARDTFLYWVFVAAHPDEFGAMFDLRDIEAEVQNKKQQNIRDALVVAAVSANPRLSHARASGKREKNNQTTKGARDGDGDGDEAQRVLNDVGKPNYDDIHFGRLFLECVGSYLWEATSGRLRLRLHGQDVSYPRVAEGRHAHPVAELLVARRTQGDGRRHYVAAGVP